MTNPYKIVPRRTTYKGTAIGNAFPVRKMVCQKCKDILPNDMHGALRHERKCGAYQGEGNRWGLASE